MLRSRGLTRLRSEAQIEASTPSLPSAQVADGRLNEAFCSATAERSATLRWQPSQRRRLSGVMYADQKRPRHNIDAPKFLL